ncbi:hypothetical protein DFQ11_10727 [Winogradskyella epiphytica]|uniref:Lipocalin-like protein n=1 Tax=Winogradskyella epiphytica TaxID=262005 RepID=A0A2V4YAM7_9FLAO|nr:hypothetical protein [Winogradskyella epiphytica]PYE80063.1 hypothetical protein DFQ11_10727 [Winogradskyella epiphytica]GGW71148.1 hypothetical protein GCM10008085_23950 [Winogradskyella epiphytica]
MITKLTSLKSFIYILIFGVITCSCSKPKDVYHPGQGPSTADGNYELVKINKSWTVVTPTSHIPHVENLTTGCALLSTLKFKSNKTFEFTDYNNDNDCTDFEIISGNWIETRNSPAGFGGELNFNSKFRGFNTYDVTYSSEGNISNGRNVSLRIKTVVEGQEYWYNLLFYRV